MSFKPTNIVLLFLVLVAVWLPGSATAQTPGYPEKVVQWTVQSGESCEDVAKALYGSASHKRLVQRYNSVACTPGAPLKNGLTLVMPAKVTTLPAAKITSVKQDTRARPSGGGWGTAYPGQSLGKASSVNTRAEGRAGIQFRDRTRVYLAEHTLVIIYGSASQTQVSKSPPPVVKLDSGEVQAVLSALRGSPMAIELEGGGRVDAASKDAVVARKGTQTNVSVFDGRAAVSNMGKSVDVPKNFGTRFWEQKKPEKPRPLPPAPNWGEGSSSGVNLAYDGAGVIAATWTAIPKAKTYRLEIARNAEFTDLIAREHVPATVLAFRAEKIPAGRYYVRVRAIDTDDFLGIASAVRTVSLIGAKWTRGTGEVAATGLSVGRFAILKLDPAEGLEMAFDDAPFGPELGAIDFRRLNPKILRFRHGTAAPETLPVAYVDPEAKLSVARDGTMVNVSLQFDKVDGLDVAKVLNPKAWVVVDEQRTSVPLAKVGPGLFRGTAQVASADVPVQVVARDDFGRTLARGSSVPAPPPPPDLPPPPPPPARYRIGAMTPMLGLSPRMSVLWTSPTAENHGALGVRIDSVASPVALQGFAHAAGAIGPVGIDATVMTPATEDADADSSALIGLRYRAYRNEGGSFEFGPVVRVGFPLDDVGPSPRFEPTLAAGGHVDDWSWLLNSGARIRLDGPSDDRVFVDAMQWFVLGGGAYEALPWLSLYTYIDFHVLVPGASMSTLGRGGLSLGVEAGEQFFVSVGGRLSPWDDVGAGHVAGQLAIGFRED